MYFIFENLNQSAIIILKFHSRENKIINSVIKTVLLRLKLQHSKYLKLSILTIECINNAIMRCEMMRDLMYFLN